MKHEMCRARKVSMMKSVMRGIVQYSRVLNVCVAVVCLNGCGTVETIKNNLVGKNGKSEGRYHIEAPKACPGTLEESYLVIDISGGQAAATWPVTTFNQTPAEGWSDEYKTDKIVLRKVNAGSYWRQRCTAEEAWNRKTDNPPCEMFVNKSFYMGVFEITQRQYEHVTGMRPSSHSPSNDWETLPVENVSYDDIRGRHEGACFPSSRSVDAWSFVGILRQKTGLMNLDLPSEDIWEYCCSAGGSFVDLKSLDSNARFCRYPTTRVRYKAPVAVGSYRPNVLGLYDMQGNVQEWCLDRIGKEEPREITLGQFGCNRVVKGGFYDSLAELCHPSIAYGQCSSFGDSTIGFRICCY